MSNDARARILARRALFLSSALVSVGSTTRAGADEVESTTPFSELPPLPDTRSHVPPRPFSEPRVCLSPVYDPHNPRELRRKVRVVIEVQAGGVVGLRGASSLADTRLGLAANVPLSRDYDDTDFRIGIEGTFSTPAVRSFAVMGKLSLLYAWCSQCLSGVDNTKMFSGLVFAAGYQGVSAPAEELIRVTSGLRLEPELIPFGLRFGELRQFELGLHVGLRLSKFVDPTVSPSSHFGANGLSASLGFTWMMFPARPPPDRPWL